MRFILLFLLFGCTQIGMAQQDFKFDESDYQTMLQKAKTEKKPVFLMLYADWCPHCNKMKNSVLKDVAVIDFLSKNYLCKALNSDLPESTAIKTKFHTTTLPTFLILDSGENELYRLKGEYTTQQFLAEIQNANNPKQQLPYLEKEFTADPSNTQKWMNYMLALRKGYERTYLNEKAKPYFATQTDQQLISRENWQIIANCVTEIPSREFQLVLSHQKEFESVSSPLRVERKIINIASELLKPYTLNLDTLNYYKQREIAQSIQSQKVDSLIFKYDLTIAERTQNWDE